MYSSSNAPARKPKHRYLYHPKSLVRGFLPYDHAQQSNQERKWRRAKHIHNTRKRLIASGVEKPSIRQIAFSAKACRKTVAEALRYSWDFVLSSYEEALELLCSRSSKDLETLTQAFKNALDRAKYQYGKEKEHLSKDPELAALQRRCFERARVKDPPVVVKKSPPPKPIPPKDDLSVILKPGEKKLWFSGKKLDIQEFLGRKFPRWRKWSGRPPTYVPPKNGPFALWRLQSH